MKAASDTVKRVILEMGGRDRISSWTTLTYADLDTAVDGAPFARMAYSGQACERREQAERTRPRGRTPVGPPCA